MCLFSPWLRRNWLEWDSGDEKAGKGKDVGNSRKRKLKTKLANARTLKKKKDMMKQL